jgi:hypothetical protein
LKRSTGAKASDLFGRKDIAVKGEDGLKEKLGLLRTQNGSMH